jgi:hypothetical protein
MNPLYSQINEQCTAEEIRNLLRIIQDRSNKAKSDILISGSKDDLVKNLELAVQLRHCTEDEVYKLLWDSEEVGKQHILLLRPAPAGLAAITADITDGSSVASALFDEMSLGDLFPQFDYPVSGYAWVDFRMRDNGGWLGKAYGREVFRQSRGAPETVELAGGIIQEIRQYSWKEVKAVLVANWRAAAGIFELRVDISNLQNEKNLEDRRAALWNLLKPAFSSADVIGIDIDGLLGSIIFQRDEPENRKRYTVSRVELTDPRSGQVRVIPKASEALDDDLGRRASLEAMQKNQFKPSLARVEWKNGLDDCPDCMTEPVSVVIEKTSNGPELRILKRITNATYEYIFNQLRGRLLQCELEESS